MVLPCPKNSTNLIPCQASELTQVKNLAPIQETHLQKNEKKTLTGVEFFCSVGNMKMTLQNVGSSVVLFIYGTRQEILDRHNSLYNWAAIGATEPRYLSDDCAICWTTFTKLRKYFFNLAVMELWGDGKKGKKNGVAPEAWAIADKRVAEVSQEPHSLSWGNSLDIHEMGEVIAEKPDDDLLDYFVTRGLTQS